MSPLPAMSPLPEMSSQAPKSQQPPMSQQAPISPPPEPSAGSPGGIEVVAVVSHELRAPLTSIKGYTRLLLDHWDDLADDDKRMMLREIDRDAGRVSRLIGELLDIGRLDSGRLELHRRPVELPVLTRSVLDRIRFQHPDLDARVAWADGLPAVWADPDKVEQVLTNLVENACKYASPKGLVISGEMVSGEMAAGEVAVVVSDRGAGIRTDDLAHIFTRSFRRAGGHPDGSGLGLWISRGLIESHGGRLTASSIPGQGSTFRFTLPTTDPEKPADPDKPADPEKSADLAKPADPETRPTVDVDLRHPG